MLRLAEGNCGGRGARPNAAAMFSINTPLVIIVNSTPHMGRVP